MRSDHEVTNGTRAPLNKNCRFGTRLQRCRRGGDGEWLRYVEHDKARRASTVRDYRHAAEGSLLPEFGAETPLEAITTERIETYRRRLLTEGKVSRRTIQKLMTLLHGALTRAVATG